MLTHSLRMRAVPGIRTAPPPRHGPRGINHLAAAHADQTRAGGRQRAGADESLLRLPQAGWEVPAVQVRTSDGLAEGEVRRQRLADRVERVDVAPHALEDALGVVALLVAGGGALVQPPGGDPLVVAVDVELIDRKS